MKHRAHAREIIYDVINYDSLFPKVFVNVESRITTLLQASHIKRIRK